MIRTDLLACMATLALPLMTLNAQAAGPTFAKDRSFSAQDVLQAKTLGAAQWSMKDGDIVGQAVKGVGGWLLLPVELANLAGYAEFRCDKACAAGVLFRAVPTPTGGLKGVLVSASPVGGGAFEVEIDAQGREVARTLLKQGKSDGGLANAFGNIPAETLAALSIILSAPDFAVPGISKASGEYLPRDWNAVNFIAYNDMLKPSLNGAPGAQYLPDSLMPDSAGGYGAVALYVGGSGTVQFRNVQVKDLNSRNVPAEVQSKNFVKMQIDEMYYSWGPAVGDFNKDGQADIVAGPFFWEGPTFEKSHEIYTPVQYNPGTEYPQKSFINLVYDFNGDGWDDVLVISGSAGYSTVTLNLNPRGQSRHWDSCVVLKPIGNEETLFEDIDGDGRPELIHAFKNAMAYSTWDMQHPCSWSTTIVSDPGPWGSYIGHGIGVGDINGDGREDIVSAYGWFEQPADKSVALWKFHPQAFGRRGESQGGAGGAQLGVYDVNGDGLADVVTPLEGHGFGLAWYEQQRAADGSPAFVQHMIMDGFLTRNAGDVMFTQPHASAFADIDGDGIKDFITGKRYMSHLLSLSGDPDPFGAPVLYVYKVVRNPAAPGGAEFVPELINNRSGVGSHLAVVDVNGDGKPDIVTSGALGTILFLNQTGAAAPH
jgi:hypothetical protein